MNPSDVETSSASARPGRTPAAGDVLAERYQLVQRIASGGSAEVFEAEHAVTRRRVAVKVLRADAKGELASVERFFREASACAGIDSDHIVAVLDCDVDRTSGAPFIVMELLHGKDLARFIADTLAQGTPVPPSLAMNLLKQVASALDKVHAQGIVHRDLKPANLFLTFPSDGPARVKVLDFGIARIAADGVGSGASRVGTPLYMSAEQLAGSDTITLAADIWSFALIAYELLVGHPYWTGNTAASLFARIPDAEAHPKPTELAVRHGVHLPRAFDPWLLRCIDPDPTRRPPSVGEALGDLLRLYDPKATQPPSRASVSPVAPIPSRLAPRASSSRPPPPRASIPAVAPSRPSVPIVVAPPSAPPAPPAPPAPMTEELDDDEIEDLTETSDVPIGLREALAPITPSTPAPSASEARTLRVEPISERVDEDRRLTIPLAPAVASLFGPPLRHDVEPDEPVTAELPAAHLPSTAAPRDLADSPELPDPAPEPVDTLGANVAAALEDPHASRPARRVPRSLELAATALLPVQAPAPPPPPAVKPVMLIAAAVVTLGLASVAGWVLFGRRVATPASVRGDGVWHGPSAFESASLASTTSVWAGALRVRVDATPPASGLDTARTFHALLSAHRAGVALPSDRLVAMVVALDRFRTPRGWPAPDRPGPDAEATAQAALAYAAMAEVTRADTGRVRVNVARTALLELQRPDGSFELAGDPTAAPLATTSLAVSALLAAESAAGDATPDAITARRRAVHVLRDALQRSDHPVWSAPPALDRAIAALWSARAQAHDVDPADEGIAARYADHLGERCADQRCAVIAPLAEAPWVPGALVTSARLLRDSASLPPSSLRSLSTFVRAGIAAMDRDRAYDGGGDTRWLASALSAAGELQR